MVSIHKAAELLGVSAQTLRRWEREGRLLPDERTPGGRRRYDPAVSRVVPRPGNGAAHHR
ncbi:MULTISPECIES: MerR family transcriptional regulator [Chloracidobacterium]|uniref:MerR family transcriptional regulator n=1 Tax=Chloracidobacterium TaxID=458032 RepID=UPI00059FBB2B|nr:MULTISPECIES: helix-turn-helix domain-containing protein [Chloracidobacterium]